MTSEDEDDEDDVSLDKADMEPEIDVGKDTLHYSSGLK